MWRDAGGPITRRLRERGVAAGDALAAVVQRGQPDSCWPCTERLNRDGYGVISLDGRDVLAHRLALELSLWRAIGAQEVVRHLCHFRACCNPAHLAPGSVADNNRDTFEAGRTARGEKSGKAKLTQEQIEAIRREFRSGQNYKALAAAYGISSRQVYYIARGERWRHLDDFAGVRS